ncbi:FIG00545237: hypothetical protein [hydrothermal vent metagenome]|uniref:Uncharacterized protein n=1 Tax=hydrothermal vent metagenome TaxID=652676 RepID=A0A1W1CFT6_9ZZZZ
MYRNFIKVIISGIILSSISIKANSMKAKEDELIIKAIWLEENLEFNKSANIYSILYKNTNKKEYLFKEISIRFYTQNKIPESLKKLKKWNRLHPKNLIGKRLLITIYLQEKEYNNATLIGKTLIESSDKEEDLELVASSYLYNKNYKKGIDLLTTIYHKNNNENVLLRIVAVMTQYMDKNIEAIQLLETHRMINNVSIEAYKMLIDLYIKEKNIDKILNIYKVLYKRENNDEYKRRIIEIYVYKRDFKNMIKFLEESEGNNDILYDLYKKEKEFKKAIKLANKFYKDTQNPKWLAELAILTYEDAEDKNSKKILKKFRELFDKAITLGVDDSIYLNYYGYTLIDKNIDIDRGIKMIKNALKQQPKNSYYLDSIAWGYFKKLECQKAYKIMKQVIDKEGTKEIEIKEHWENIKECI